MASEVLTLKDALLELMTDDSWDIHHVLEALSLIAGDTAEGVDDGEPDSKLCVLFCRRQRDQLHRLAEKFRAEQARIEADEDEVA
jgi:hypothetical protein